MWVLLKYMINYLICCHWLFCWSTNWPTKGPVISAWHTTEPLKVFVPTCGAQGLSVMVCCLAGGCLAFPHVLNTFFKHIEASSSQPSSWENSLKECTEPYEHFDLWCIDVLAASSFYSLLSDNEVKQAIVSFNLKVSPAIVNEGTAQGVQPLCWLFLPI